MIVKLCSQSFSFADLCVMTDLPPETILEIVDSGIVNPDGVAPDNWVFSTHMVTMTKKAFRLHRDLEIDWPGIALAISLLEELEELRTENQDLNRRLKRFMTG